jgi:hypothetical protein
VRWSGFALAAALAAGSGCILNPVDLGSHDEFEAEFELFWQTVDRHYAGFPVSSVDWAQVRDQYLPAVDTLSSQADFVAICWDMAEPLHDMAVSVGLGEDTLAFIPDLQCNCDSTVLWQYLQPAGFQWFTGENWGWCLLEGAVYVLILEWTSTMVLAEMDDVLAQHPEASALVLDIRLNSGDGSSVRIAEVARRFNDEVRVGYYKAGRDGPGHEDFGEPLPRMIYTRAGGFDAPVYLLSGEACTRTSEEFACACGRIPAVTLVGDTTAGQVGWGFARSLPGGAWFTLADSTVLDPDMEFLQGSGVPPDVFVEAGPDQFQQGVDPVLEHVLEMIR